MNGSGLQVERTVRPHVEVVRVTGRIAAETADDFEWSLRASAASGPKAIVVDLSGVEFIASVGWGILLSARHAARRAGGDLALAGVRSSVQMTMRALGLDKVFEVREVVPSVAPVHAGAPSHRVPQSHRRNDL